MKLNKKDSDIVRIRADTDKAYDEAVEAGLNPDEVIFKMKYASKLLSQDFVCPKLETHQQFGVEEQAIEVLKDTIEDVSKDKDMCKVLTSFSGRGRYSRQSVDNPWWLRNQNPDQDQPNRKAEDIDDR